MVEKFERVIGLLARALSPHAIWSTAREARLSTRQEMRNCSWLLWWQTPKLPITLEGSDGSL